MPKTVEGDWFRALVELERPGFKYLKSFQQSSEKINSSQSKVQPNEKNPHGTAKGNVFSGRGHLMRSSLKMQFVRLSFRLQSRDLRGPSPQLRRQQSRAGLRKLALCFVFLLWNALAQLCGSRGSLLNGPKELSSKPESSKCSPNTCGGRAELQLKGSRRQYR